MGIVRNGNRFLLNAGGSSYLIEISGDGLPVNLHWGASAGMFDVPDAPVLYGTFFTVPVNGRGSSGRNIRHGTERCSRSPH